MKKHVDRLKVMFGKSHVGTLATADRGQLFFEYTPEWLATGFDLAPRSLAFNAVLQKAKDPLFDGLHGVFNDSLPDGWGLLLMDREFNKRLGWSRHQITPLDRLAYMGNRAMGALSYEPAFDNERIEDTADLSALATSVEAVLSGSTEDVFSQTWGAWRKPMPIWPTSQALLCRQLPCCKSKSAPPQNTILRCADLTGMPMNVATC